MTEIFRHYNFNGINPGWYSSIAVYHNYMAAAFVDNHRIRVLLFRHEILIQESYLDNSDFRLYGFYENEWRGGKPYNDGHHAPSLEFDKFGRLWISADEHHASPSFPKDRHPRHIKGAPKLEWVSTEPYSLNFKFVGHNFPGHGVSYTKYRRCPKSGDMWMICRHHHLEYDWNVIGFQGLGVYKLSYKTDKWINFMGDKISLFNNQNHGYIEERDGELVDTNYQGYKGDLQIDKYGDIHICTVMSNHTDLRSGNSLMYAFCSFSDDFFVKKEIYKGELDDTISLSFANNELTFLCSNRYKNGVFTLSGELDDFVLTKKEVTGKLLIPENLEINYYEGRQYINSFHPKSNILIDNQPNWFSMMTVCNDTSKGLYFLSLDGNDLVLNKL